MLSSVQEEPQFYELFETILHGFLSEIISKTSQIPIKTFLQHFEISLPRLGKNMSICKRLYKNNLFLSQFH